MNQASNVLGGFFSKSPADVIAEMISYRQKDITVNQASNIPVLAVLGRAVGRIIEMIRHYTVNQASNLRVSVFSCISAIGSGVIPS